MKNCYYIVISLFIISSLQAQTHTYNEAKVLLRNGDTLSGKLKLNNLSTALVYKNETTGEKRKLSPREVKLAWVKTSLNTTATISFKIIEAKGAEPKIVQHLVQGNVMLYKKLDKDHDFYTTLKKSTSMTNGTSASNEFYGAPANYSLLYKLMVRSEKIWFYSRGPSDVVKTLPKKRNDIMKLFNDCPSAMINFRDVDEKEFDFIYFLNYYNVECPY